MLVLVLVAGRGLGVDLGGRPTTVGTRPRPRRRRRRSRAAVPATGHERRHGGGKRGPATDKDRRARPRAASAETTGSAALERSVRRFRAAQRRLAQRVSEQLERRTAPVEFRVASFNVLGDSHTGPGGNKPAFYPDGSARMDMAIAILRNNGDRRRRASRSSRPPSTRMFTARAGEYSLYPGLSLGDKSVRFNIAWRSGAFTLVEAHTISIPYAGGSRIEMPVVLLESTTTERRAWFANFHNPADTPSLGNNARWRAEAAGIEIAHLTALHEQEGVPVIVTGDFNERAEIFCRFTAGRDLLGGGRRQHRRRLRAAPEHAGGLDLRVDRRGLRQLCRDRHRPGLRPRHGARHGRRWSASSEPGADSI